MKSETPKPLKKLAGKPLIFWTLDLLEKSGIKDVVVVTGYKADVVEEKIKSDGYNVSFMNQGELLGTAHSARQGLKKVPEKCKDVLILFADDSAFYSEETIRKLIIEKRNSESPGSLLVLRKKRPTELGGLEKDDKGRPVGVLTKSGLERENYKQYEILCGAFCFDKDWLEENIKKVQKSEYSGEFPLPGLIKISADMNQHLLMVPLSDENEWRSINSQEQLKKAQELKGKNAT